MIKLFLALAAVTLTATPCTAEKAKHHEISRVVHVTGTIVEVSTAPDFYDGEDAITMLTLLTNGKPKYFLLGPQKWMSEQDIDLAKGSKFEVTVPYISDIAAHSITIDGKTVTIFDDEGKGQW